MYYLYILIWLKSIKIFDWNWSENLEFNKKYRLHLKQIKDLNIIDKWNRH